MNAKALCDMVVQGASPIVRLTDCLWDSSFGQKGMIAQVVSGQDREGDGIKLTFDYTANREHNLSLDLPNWYLKDDRMGTAVEAGQVDPENIREDVFFDEVREVPIEFMEKDSLISRYVESGYEGTYQGWLEEVARHALKATGKTSSFGCGWCVFCQAKLSRGIPHKGFCSYGKLETLGAVDCE